MRLLVLAFARPPSGSIAGNVQQRFPRSPAVRRLTHNVLQKLSKFKNRRPKFQASTSGELGKWEDISTGTTKGAESLARLRIHESGSLACAQGLRTFV
jgi:hypothetical protein